MWIGPYDVELRGWGRGGSWRWTVIGISWLDRISWLHHRIGSMLIGRGCNIRGLKIEKFLGVVCYLYVVTREVGQSLAKGRR